MTTIKPNRAEVRTVREACKAACAREGMRLDHIEPGIRFSEDINDSSMNILLVDSTPDWEESDLWRMSDWPGFKRGFPEAEGGRAVIDLYCYDRHGELITNAQAKFDGGRLVWAGTLGPWGFSYFGDPALQERGE